MEGIFYKSHQEDHLRKSLVSGRLEPPSANFKHQRDKESDERWQPRDVKLQAQAQYLVR